MATIVDNSRKNLLYLCEIVQHHNNVCKIGNDFAKEIDFSVDEEIQNSLTIEEIPTKYEKVLEKTQALSFKIFDATCKVFNGTLKISVDKVKKLRELQGKIDQEALAIKNLEPLTLLSSDAAAHISSISFGLKGFITQVLISNGQGNFALLEDRFEDLTELLK